MAEEIVEEIKWTISARASFYKIVDYLQKEWSEKEAEKFILRTEDMVANLRRYPEMCRPSLKRKNVRIGILNRHTQIIYYYKPGNKRLVLLLFWGMKQNPVKLKY